MSLKRKDLARAGEPSFAHLRDKIDQALKTSEPQTAKRKSEDDGATKLGPRKKQQRHKPAANSPRTEKPKVKSKENGPRKQAKAQPAADDSLLAEIRALGGDEADLDLVMGVPSDSENEYNDSTAPLSQDVRHEIAQFANQLGFSQADVRDAESDEEEQSEFDGGDNEGAESVEPAQIERAPIPPGSKGTVRRLSLHVAYSSTNSLDLRAQGRLACSAAWEFVRPAI